MTKFANSVNGATGDASIAGMWKNSFEALYNMDNTTVTTDYHFFNDANVNKLVNDNVHEICTRDLLTARPAERGGRGGKCPGARRLLGAR